MVAISSENIPSEGTRQPQTEMQPAIPTRDFLPVKMGITIVERMLDRI